MNATILTLFLIIVILPVGHMMAQSKSQLRKSFKAYDCSAPVAIEPIFSPEEEVECRLKANATRQVEASYLLLVKSGVTRTMAKRCSAVRTEIVFYCGNADHQTFVPEYTSIGRPFFVDPVTCARYWNDLTFEEGRSKQRTLVANGTTYITWENVGSTWSEGFGYQVQCTGADFWHGGRKILDRIISFVQMDITLMEVELHFPEVGLPTESQSGIALGCPASAGTCLTGAYTHLWTPIEEECKYYLGREVRGIEVTDDYGETTFISNDATMTRLVRHSAQVACGHVIYSTNYPTLFLSTDRDPLFLRDLDPKEFSISTYVNQKDDFMYGYLTDSIRQEHAATLLHSCRARQDRNLHAFGKRAAVQHASMAGTTTPLGDGVFATAAGEVWYRYLCPPIVVAHRKTLSCFESLPIRLSDENWATYANLRNLTITNDQAQLFLEPNSRRVVAEALPLPCIPELAPMFTNSLNEWVKAVPSLQLTHPPLAAADAAAVQPMYDFKKFDFGQGGYVKPDVVRKWEVFVSGPTRGAILGARLSNQRHTTDSDGYLYLHDSYPDLPSQDVLDFWWGWSTFLDRWGKVCSIGMGLLFTMKALTWLFGVACRIIHSPRIDGWGRHMIGIFMPSFRELSAAMSAHRKRRADKKADRKDESNIYSPPPPARPSDSNAPPPDNSVPLLNIDPADLDLRTQELDHHTLRLQLGRYRAELDRRDELTTQ
jgi:hypothetical protein